LNIPKKLFERPACVILAASYCLLIFILKKLQVNGFLISIGVAAVTALVKFGEVWTPIMRCAFQDLFWRSTATEKRCVAGCQSRFNCLLKFLKDN
jgi:hypothetical protein